MEKEATSSAKQKYREYMKKQGEIRELFRALQQKIQERNDLVKGMTYDEETFAGCPYDDLDVKFIVDDEVIKGENI